MKPFLMSTLVLVATIVSAAAQDRTKLERRNVDLVMRMFDEGWGANTGWEDVWRAKLSPTFTSYFHAFPPTEGLEAAIAFNRDLFAGFPKLEVTVEAVTAEGENVVVRARLKGKHEGPFLGVPASGAVVNVPDVTLFRVKDGKITESRYFTDLVMAMTAMGAIPPMR